MDTTHLFEKKMSSLKWQKLFSWSFVPSFLPFPLAVETSINFINNLTISQN